MESRVTHSLVNALRAVPSFASVDDQLLLAIIGDSANLYWPEGSVVFERGSPADGLFIVLSGRVRVLDEGGADIAVLGPGDFFGELSLLLGTTHQHDVHVDEPAELMVVPKEKFDELIASNPELGRQVRRKAEERMGAAGPVVAPQS
jgi:CRP-like cAMP-binding protein